MEAIELTMIKSQRPLPRVVNINDLLTLAKRRLPKAVFDYVDGGAEQEVTLRNNCEAFKQVTFRPKQAVSVGALRAEHTSTGSRLRFSGYAGANRLRPTYASWRGTRNTERRRGTNLKVIGLPCHERIRYVLREISARVAGNELILHFGAKGSSVAPPHMFQCGSALTQVSDEDKRE